MKKICIILSGIVLAGCASSNEMYTADGNMVYAISCKVKSADACIEKAGEICGSLGYTRVAADGGPMPVASVVPSNPPSPPNAAAASQAIPISPSDITWNQKIYVKCNVGQSQEPQ